MNRFLFLEEELGIRIVLLFKIPIQWPPRMYGSMTDSGTFRDNCETSRYHKLTNKSHGCFLLLTVHLAVSMSREHLFPSFRSSFPLAGLSCAHVLLRAWSPSGETRNNVIHWLNKLTNERTKGRTKKKRKNERASERTKERRELSVTELSDCIHLIKESLTHEKHKSRTMRPKCLLGNREK